MKRTGSVSGSPAEKRPNTAQDEVHEHSAILFAEVDPGCAKEKLRWKRSPVGVSDVNETDLGTFPPFRVLGPPSFAAHSLPPPSYLIYISVSTN